MNLSYKVTFALRDSSALRVVGTGPSVLRGHTLTPPGVGLRAIVSHVHRGRIAQATETPSPRGPVQLATTAPQDKVRLTHLLSHARKVS